MPERRPDLLMWAVQLRNVAFLIVIAIVIASHVSEKWGDFVTYFGSAFIFLIGGFGVVRESRASEGKFSVFGLFCILLGFSYLIGISVNLDAFSGWLGNGTSKGALLFYGSELLVAFLSSKFLERLPALRHHSGDSDEDEEKSQEDSDQAL
jgi:hypothetical protein